MNFSTLIVLFVLGILLLMLEAVIPGGIVGAVGGCMLLLSTILAFIYHDTLMGLYFLGASLFGSTLSLCITYYLLAKTDLGNWMVHKPDTSPQKQTGTRSSELGHLVGKTGETTTDLSPGGWAEFDGERHEVVSDGFMIDKGQKIRVLEVEGNQIRVEEVEEEEGGNQNNANP